MKSEAHHIELLQTISQMGQLYLISSHQNAGLTNTRFVPVETLSQRPHFEQSKVEDTMLFRHSLMYTLDAEVTKQTIGDLNDLLLQQHPQQQSLHHIQLVEDVCQVIWQMPLGRRLDQYIDDPTTPTSNIEFILLNYLQIIEKQPKMSTELDHFWVDPRGGLSFVPFPRSWSPNHSMYSTFIEQIGPKLKQATWLDQLSALPVHELEQPQLCFHLKQALEAVLRPTKRVGLSVDTNKFVGRDKALKWLEGKAQSRQTCNIYGAPGIGKSRLLRHWANHTSGKHHHIVYCNLSKANSIEQLNAQLAIVLGLSLKQRNLTKAIRETLQIYPGTILICDQCQPSTALEQWIEYWSMASLQFMIVSTHPMLQLPHRLYIEPMLEHCIKDGILCLRERIQEQGNSDSVFTDEQLQQVIEHYGGAPLSIELLAVNMAGTFEAMLTIEQLLCFETNKIQGDVKSSIELTLHFLDKDDRAAFYQLACFTSSFELNAAEAVIDGVDDVFSLLEMFWDHKLLDFHPESKRFELPEAILNMLRQNATQHPKFWHEVLSRFVAHYAQFGTDEHLMNAQHNVSLYRKLEKELEHFKQAIDWIIEYQLDGHLAAQCTTALGLISYWRGPTQLGIDAIEQCLKLSFDPQQRMKLLSRAASLYDQSGQFVSAIRCHQLALELAIKHCNEERQLFCWGNLGRIEVKRGNIEQAQNYLEQALAIKQTDTSANNQSHRSIWIAALTHIHIHRFEFKRAWELAQESHQIAVNLNYERIIAVRVGTFGCLARQQGRMDESKRYLEKARQLSKDFGDLLNESIWLGNLGIISRQKKDYEKAFQHFQSALDTATKLGANQRMATWRTELAQLHFEQGNTQKALSHLEIALLLVESTNEKLLPNRIKGLTALCKPIPITDKIELLETCLQEATMYSDAEHCIYWMGHLAQLYAQSNQFELADKMMAKLKLAVDGIDFEPEAFSIIHYQNSRTIVEQLKPTKI